MIRLFPSSLPAYFHRGILADLAPFADRELGHELATITPRALAVLEDDAVLGEVASMLGPGALPDACMHLHLNNRAEDGPWHPDDYCGKPWPTTPMAILCYFPQSTPRRMGPTEARWGGGSIVASGPAGTCLLMRNDVEHRATANRTGRQRFMLKFLFGAIKCGSTD